MAVTREGSRVARRDFEETAGRSPDAAPAPLAQRVLALQHSAGNVAVRNMLEARARLPAAAVLARAPHRPPQGGQINYQGAIWNVVTSTKEKPTITIQQPTGKKQRRDISWEYEDFWIIRENVGGDYDMREEGQEEDADLIRERFDAAKLRALQMLKDFALPHVQQTSKQALRDLTLDGSFQVTQRNRNTDGVQEACEWMLTWKEGTDPERPRRIWKFTIDVDNPPATSDQEPHVGWDARAEPGGFGKADAVERQLGHIWLNAVPVGRGAFVH